MWGAVILTISMFVLWVGIFAIWEDPEFGTLLIAASVISGFGIMGGCIPVEFTRTKTDDYQFIKRPDRLVVVAGDATSTFREIKDYTKIDHLKTVTLVRGYNSYGGEITDPVIELE